MEANTLDDTASRPEEVRECADAEADREDLALVEKALEEYGAKGIEGASPYSEYRKRRLGDSS